MPGRYSDIVAQHEREAKKARRSRKYGEASRLRKKAAEVKDAAKTRAKSAVKKKVQGPVGISAVEEAKRRRYGGPSVQELQARLKAAVASGKSMMAKQLRKRIAAAKRAQAAK